jgi:hypothetical protein
LPACSCCAPKAARRGTVRWLASGIWKAPAEARKHACTIPKGECTEGCRHGRALRVSEHGSLCARVRRKHTHA